MGVGEESRDPSPTHPSLVKLREFHLMIRISRASFELSLVASIIKETESLFLALLAQREGVGGGELRLATVELHELLFELLAGLFQFALVFGVVLLELLELGVELEGESESGSEIYKN